MVEENKEKALLPQSGSFEELMTEEAEIEIEVPEGEVSGTKSLKDALALSPNLSDMQAAMIKLFPEGFWGSASRLYELLMVGRISPDVFYSILRILVKSAVKRANPRKPIYVGEIVTNVYMVLSVGLDGKGRIDALELAGAAREESELKALGGGAGV